MLVVALFALAALLGSVKALPAAYNQHARSTSAEFPRKDPLLNVYVVPHSHDDVGWLKTIDEYYNEDVRPIYENVLQCLAEDRRRKFIIVEQAYFSRWFANDASPAQQSLIRRLLTDGQLEFVNGGWVMNDEACTTSEAILNQLSDGWRFINKTFGPAALPRYAYQIDPFGHSAGHASIASQMGYEAIVLNRVHFEEKMQRERAGRMEFQWHVGDHQIRAHILDHHYSSPRGLDFEIDPSFQNHSDLAVRAAKFVQELHRHRRHSYPSQRHFLQLAGDDFRWRNATVQFRNWDRLIDYINHRSWLFGIRLHYATLNDYFSAVRSEQLELSVYRDRDFFPYADYPATYWTGYFTSKPFLKSATSQLESQLRSAEIAVAGCLLGGDGCSIDRETMQLLKIAREASAELQHHDGVTGTSTERVTEMYMQHIAAAQNAITQLKSKIFGGFYKQIDLDALKGLAAGQRLPLVLFNSLDTPLNLIHEIKVPGNDFTIMTDGSGKVDFETLPSLENQNDWRLLINVQLEPFGRQTFYLTRHSTKVPIANQFTIVPSVSDPPVVVSIENQFVELRLTQSTPDPTKWQLQLIDQADKSAIPLNPWLMHYKSFTGPDGNPSGAYIMRTASDESVSTGEIVKINVLEGRLVKELMVTYNQTGFRQLFRLYDSLPSTQFRSFEIVNLIDEGAILPDTEHIIRLHVDESSSDISPIFYTDANGMQMMERQCCLSEHPYVNFYPSTSAIMKPTTNGRSLMILTDRSMAAGAQSAHSVELMIGRRTSTDDWRGVGEPLNDVRAIRVPLTIYHGDMAELEMQRVDLSRNIRHPIDTVLYESTRFIDENHDMQLPLFNGWRMFSAQLIDYDGGSIKLLLRYQASPSASTKLTAFHVRRWLDNRHSSRGGGSDAINVIGINRINLAGTTVLTEDDDGTLKFQNDFSIDDSAAVSWELRAFLIHISI